jgi:hypothetical protein
MSSDATIRQNYARTEIYDKMVDEWDIFDTYVDFFVFAASVGYRVSSRSDVAGYDEDEYTGEGEMLWMHFTNKAAYRAVAASIAYQYTGNAEALTDPDLQLDVLARYARAGVEALATEFGDSQSTPRDGLVSFIDDYEDIDESKRSDEVLDEIITSFDRDMFNMGEGA